MTEKSGARFSPASRCRHYTGRCDPRNFHGSSGGQGTKLTRKESELIAIIEQSQWTEFTIPMLQRVTGLSNGCLHKIVHGYDSRGANYSGLLDKCPAIAYTDRTVVADDDMTGVSTRRRTNAYTIDRDLYKQWSVGGGVWLKEGTGPQDPDENLYGSVRHDCCIPTACKEHKEKSATPPDSVFNSNNIHLDLSNTVYCCKTENTQQPVRVSHYTSDPERAAINYPKTAKNLQSSEPESESSRIGMQHSGNTNNSVRHTGDCSAGELMTVGVNIHATDYKSLNFPEPHVPCYCCGKKGSWYVEKLTVERKARLKDDQAARRVCRKCYDAAVRRNHAAAPPLPSMIDLPDMERHSPNIGKCLVTQDDGCRSEGDLAQMGIMSVFPAKLKRQDNYILKQRCGVNTSEVVYGCKI